MVCCVVRGINPVSSSSRVMCLGFTTPVSMCKGKAQKDCACLTLGISPEMLSNFCVAMSWGTKAALALAVHQFFFTKRCWTRDSAALSISIQTALAVTSGRGLMVSLYFLLHLFLQMW